MKKALFNYDSNENMYIADDLISYTDGSEKFFIDLFSSAGLADIDDETALTPHIKDWPTRYHLSPERINVIRPFFELLNAAGNVLEIGAGMGAITRWLGKKFAHVDCIEGNINRAKALRARTRDIGNVDVYAGNAMKANLNDNEYNLATLIGVLEYIPYYSSSTPEASVVDFLRNINKTLADDGILIISIENKFGLKYLSGCVEDHNETLFSGIMDYPFKSALTFGRNELESLIEKAGFKNIQFYHAYPDYKMPLSVFRECDDIYNLNPDIFWPEQIRDNVPRTNLFFEPLAIESMFKERMVHYFSNSFIVLCSKSESVNLKTDWIFKKWSKAEIKPCYRLSVAIFPDKNEGYRVERKRLNDLKDDNVHFSMNLITNRKYLHGSPLIFEAYKSLMAKDEYKRFITLLLEIKLELMKNSIGKDHDGFHFVDGRFFDFTFWNLIRKNGKLVYFDNKWICKYALPVDYIMLRNVYYLLYRCADYKVVDDPNEFFRTTMFFLFPEFNQNRLTYLIELENNLTSNLQVVIDCTG